MRWVEFRQTIRKASLATYQNAHLRGGIAAATEVGSARCGGVGSFVQSLWLVSQPTSKQRLLKRGLRFWQPNPWEAPVIWGDCLWTARHLVSLADQAKIAIEGNVQWPQLGGHAYSRLEKKLDGSQPLTESTNGQGSEPDDIHWKVMLEKGQPCFKNETARACP